MKNRQLWLIAVMIIIPITFFSSTYGQRPNFSNINFLLHNEVDSVVISHYLYHDKEFSSPPPIKKHPAVKDSVTGEWTLPYNESTNDDMKDTIITLGRKKLTNAEAFEIDRRLKNRNSYNFKGGVALLDHYDISIDYYLNNEIFQSAHISSYTRKVVIRKEGCKTYLDKEKQEVNPCLFYGRASVCFEKYITAFLIKKELWKKGTIFRNLREPE